MENYNVILTVVFTAFCLAGAMFSLVRQLQMLQQNSYFPSRYFKWLKESYSVESSLSVAAFGLSSILFAFGYYIFITVLFAALLVWRIFNCISVYKNSIKKIVFTKRIIRLFVSAGIVLVLLAVLLNIGISKTADTVFFNVFSFLSCLTPVLTLISWAITLPVEKAAAKKYIADAKKRLAENKNLKVIGITGSYGKTTTKFILTRILSEKYNTVCTPHSFNTPMGVVRTVREYLRPNTEIFVCEMGAKNIGDIKEICDIVNPQYGIITAVGEQHLDTFKSVDNVFKTKFELNDAVVKNGGICLVNGGNENINKRVKPDNNTVFFGENSNYRAENISFSKNGTSFDLILKNDRIPVSTRLLGRHSVTDIVASAGLAHILGVSNEDIAFAISALKPTEHRLELKKFKNGSLIIDDAYNSNPEGCIAAVETLSNFDTMKKAVITPGLIELGEKEHDCNFNFGTACAKVCDFIILVGERYCAPVKEGALKSGFDKEKLFEAKSFSQALEIFLKLADDNTVCLLENDLPDNYLK